VYGECLSSTILDHALVTSRYFFPRPNSFPTPHWVDAADGSKLACYYQAVNPAAKTVVYFHGNGEVVADYLPEFPAWMARVGCNLLLAEYRGYAMPNCSMPQRHNQKRCTSLSRADITYFLLEPRGLHAACRNLSCGPVSHHASLVMAARGHPCAAHNTPV
jgi:hypothetical protein